MKRLILMLIVLGVVFGVTNQGWTREASAYKWEVSAMAGGAFPQEDDEDATGYFGGRMTYNINQFIGIGVESGWMSFEQEDSGVDLGDVTGIPLLANLVLRYPIEATDNRVVPYLVGGLGVTFWNYDESSAVSNAGIEIDGDTAFTGKIGVGADVYVTDNVALFAEGGYMWSEYEADVSAFGAVAATTINTDMMYAQGGLKVAF